MHYKLPRAIDNILPSEHRELTRKKKELGHFL